MLPRPLGRSGPTVTPLGLGLAALGRPGYLNLGHAADLEGRRSPDALERHMHAMLDRAWAAGIRYLDAARSYGLAEAFLASWLRARDIPPGAVTVGSKWGYRYTAGWQADAAVHEVKEHTLENLRRQWDESAGLLGPWLGLYQIHSATLESGVLDDARVLGELAALRAAHGVRIGLSLSGPAQAAALERALAVAGPSGAPLFDAVQATWNLLEPSAGEALARAHGAGLGVIVKEALANGRLTERDADPASAPGRALLRTHARRLGTTVDALALAAALARPWADVVLSGAATPAQLDSNLRALQVVWDDEAEAGLAALREPPRRYWGLRGTLVWS